RESGDVPPGQRTFRAHGGARARQQGEHQLAHEDRRHRHEEPPQLRPRALTEDRPADEDPQRQHEGRRQEPPEEGLTQPQAPILRPRARPESGVRCELDVRASGRMEADERIFPMIELRTPAEIDEMRAAGRFVAETLATLRDETKVGTNLLSIDRHAHDLIRKAGAESCYIDYAPSFGNGPFGKVICTSINDAVLHGLPHDYTLRDGD